MAVVKTSIYNSDNAKAAEALYNYLLENAVPKYFSKVVHDPSALTIKCYCGDLEFLTITNCYNDSYFMATVTTSAGVTTTHRTSNSNGMLSYAFKTDYGIYFKSNNTTEEGFGLYKADNGETVFIAHYAPQNYTSMSYNSSAPKIYAIAENDETTKQLQVNMTETAITSLAAIPICSLCGHYVKGVYAMPFRQYSELGTLDINGTKYFSNGVWCCKDE